MYRNAGDILPRVLLEEIQKYIEGQEIYIPRRDQLRRRWGESNGTRAYLEKRNQSIIDDYRNGTSIGDLMIGYHLGYDSIRKILQKNRQRVS